MEEILASIRRIIADDDANKAPPKAAEPAVPPSAQAAPPRAPAPPPRPAVAPVPPAPPRVVTPPEPSLEQVEIDALVSRGNGRAAEPASDILDLTEAMAAPTPAAAPAPGFRTIDGHSDIVFDETEDEPEPEAAPVRDVASAPREPEERPLISQVTSAAVDSAFNTLAHTVLVQNARTLEDLVREMLRPMLKTWLDDNLPGLVERLVRAEIERVSRGRG